jgi:hypothetical protein
MQPSCPVDGDVGGTGIQSLRRGYTCQQLVEDVLTPTEAGLGKGKSDEMNAGRNKSPIDPPAEMEQNSNSPSNGGQSSPVRPASSVTPFSTTSNIKAIPASEKGDQGN